MSSGSCDVVVVGAGVGFEGFKVSSVGFTGVTVVVVVVVSRRMLASVGQFTLHARMFGVLMQSSVQGKHLW